MSNDRLDGRRVVDHDINGAPILAGNALPLPRYNIPTLAEVREKLGAWAGAEVVGRVITHYPNGSQCQQCQHRARDCSRLDFAAMRPAGKRDADGMQRVVCSEYTKGESNG